MGIGLRQTARDFPGDFVAGNVERTLILEYVN